MNRFRGGNREVPGANGRKLALLTQPAKSPNLIALNILIALINKIFFKDQFVGIYEKVSFYTFQNTSDVIIKYKYVSYINYVKRDGGVPVGWRLISAVTVICSACPTSPSTLV